MPKVSNESCASRASHTCHTLHVPLPRRVPRVSSRRAIAVRRSPLAWFAATLLSVSLAACGPSDANNESASNGTAANGNAGSLAAQAVQSAANAQLQAAAPSADGLASPVMHYAQ